MTDDEANAEFTTAIGRVTRLYGFDPTKEGGMTYLDALEIALADLAKRNLDEEEPANADDEQTLHCCRLIWENRDVVRGIITVMSESPDYELPLLKAGVEYHGEVTAVKFLTRNDLGVMPTWHLWIAGLEDHGVTEIFSVCSDAPVYPELIRATTEATALSELDMPWFERFDWMVGRHVTLVLSSHHKGSMPVLSRIAIGTEVRS